MIAPDLSKLPAPLADLLRAALEEREEQARLALAESAEQSAARASDRWRALVAAVSRELNIELIPFANIRVQPADWNENVTRRAITVTLPGLAPIIVAYESAANPPGWLQVPGFRVGGGRPLGSLKEALLAAWDAAKPLASPVLERLPRLPAGHPNNIPASESAEEEQ